jgi:hypothetical protein
MATTAMIDRLIHHAEILSLKMSVRGKDLHARPVAGRYLSHFAARLEIG